MLHYFDTMLVSSGSIKTVLDSICYIAMLGHILLVYLCELCRVRSQ